MPSDWVQMGDRMVPAVVELEHTSEGEPTLYLRCEVINGAPQCREVRIYCPEGADEIRSTDVKIRMAGRWVGVDELTETIVSRATRYKVSDDGTLTEFVPTEDAERLLTRREVRSASRAARRTLTTKLLREVAAVYRAHPDAPTKAVGEHFGLRPRTAALWVQRAREGGHLGKSRNGRKGEY